MHELSPQSREHSEILIARYWEGLCVWGIFKGKAINGERDFNASYNFTIYIYIYIYIIARFKGSISLGTWRRKQSRMPKSRASLKKETEN